MKDSFNYLKRFKDDFLKKNQNAINTYKILSTWKEVVGETIAKATKASFFKDGNLYITVNDHMWLTELKLAKLTLLKKLNKKIGKNLFKDIFFKFGKVFIETKMPENSKIDNSFNLTEITLDTPTNPNEIPIKDKDFRIQIAKLKDTWKKTQIYFEKHPRKFTTIQKQQPLSPKTNISKYINILLPDNDIYSEMLDLTDGLQDFL